MKIYLLSLAAGVLLGVFYSLIAVRSPAPPIVALLGLLGILIGEQVPPLIKQTWRGEPIMLSWLRLVEPSHVPPPSEGADPSPRR